MANARRKVFVFRVIVSVTWLLVIVLGVLRVLFEAGGATKLFFMPSIEGEFMSGKRRNLKVVATATFPPTWKYRYITSKGITRRYTLPVWAGRSAALDTLMIISYSKDTAEAADTLKFLFDMGVSPNDPVFYLVVVNGDTVSAPVPQIDNVDVIYTDNNCFEFGSYGHAMNLIGYDLILTSFKYIILMDCSARGPHLPKYWPTWLHWSRIFTSQLVGDVAATGSSLVCLSPDHPAGSCGVALEGHFVALTSTALVLARERGVFVCHTEGDAGGTGGDYMLASAVMDGGYNVETMLLKYNNVDWRNKTNWDCNANNHPSRLNAYDSTVYIPINPDSPVSDAGFNGVNVNPLEVLFHKTTWPDVVTPVLPELNTRYTMWARQRAIATGRLSVDMMEGRMTVPAVLVTSDNATSPSIYASTEEGIGLRLNSAGVPARSALVP